MRILVVGATGTIGRAVVAALMGSDEIVPVSPRSALITVDLADPSSIHAMYRAIGHVDAVVRGVEFCCKPDIDRQVVVARKVRGASTSP